jgi:hypothetical protein
VAYVDGEFDVLEAAKIKAATLENLGIKVNFCGI